MVEAREMVEVVAEEKERVAGVVRVVETGALGVAARDPAAAEKALQDLGLGLLAEYSFLFLSCQVSRIFISLD